MVGVDTCPRRAHGLIAPRAWLAALLAGATLLMAVPPVLAAAPKCLDAPADAGQIATLRDLIESACPCGDYDGAPGAKHGDYVKCAKTIIDGQSAANLRPQCKGTVKKFYAQSTCGFAAALDKTVCVKKSATGKVTCAVKSETQCVDKPTKYMQHPCAGLNQDWAHCVDAADSNDDLTIDSADRGKCNCNAGFSDCNNNRADGCEANTAFDADNCGSCAHVCTAAAGGSRLCFDGSCTSTCPAGEALCGAGPNGGGTCSDTDTDVANCGACGIVCPQFNFESCAGSLCGPFTLVRGNVNGATPNLQFCANQNSVTGIRVWVENGHISQLQGVCTDTTLGVSDLPPVGSAGGTRKRSTSTARRAIRSQASTRSVGSPA